MRDATTNNNNIKTNKKEKVRGSGVGGGGWAFSSLARILGESLTINLSIYIHAF